MADIDVSDDSERKCSIEFRGTAYALLQYLALRYRKPKAEIVKDALLLIKEQFELEGIGGHLVLEYPDNTLVRLIPKWDVSATA